MRPVRTSRPERPSPRLAKSGSTSSPISSKSISVPGLRRTSTKKPAAESSSVSVVSTAANASSSIAPSTARAGERSSAARGAGGAPSGATARGASTGSAFCPRSCVTSISTTRPPQKERSSRTTRYWISASGRLSAWAAAETASGSDLPSNLMCPLLCPGRFRARRFGGRRFVLVSEPVDDHLLNDRQHVGKKPVQNQSRGHVLEEHPPDQGHEHEDLLLGGVGGGGRHRLLGVHRDNHQDEQDVRVIDRREVPNPEHEGRVAQLDGESQDVVEGD